MWQKDYHNTKKNRKSSKKHIYSYEYDDEYIYSAFYQEYRIDLAYDKVHR